MELFEGQRESQRLWKKTPGTLPCCGGSTKPADSVGVSTGCEFSSFASNHGAILSSSSTTCDEPGSVQGILSLGGTDGPTTSRRSCSWSRPGSAKTEEFGKLRQRSSFGHQPELGTLAPGEILVGVGNRDTAGLQAVERRDEVAAEDKVSLRGKRRRSFLGVSRGKKGKSKGDGKKGKGDYKGPQKGKEEEKEKAS